MVWNHKTNEKQFYKIPDPENLDINRLSSITGIGNGKYLISVWGKFAYLWDHKKKEISALQKDNKFSKITFNQIVYSDSKGRIWLGNRDKGLFRYNPESNQTDEFAVSDLSKLENSGDEHIKYIFEDSKQRLWVGTAGGLHMLNEKPAPLQNMHQLRMKIR